MAMTDDEVFGGIEVQAQTPELGPTGTLLNILSGTQNIPVDMPPVDEVGPVGTAVEGVGRGATFGLLDKVMPTALGLGSSVAHTYRDLFNQFLPPDQQIPETSIPSPGNLFDSSMEYHRQRREAQGKAYPKTQFVSEFGGGMLTGTGIGMSKPVANLIMQAPVKGGALVGGGMGALTGAGTAERLEDVPERMAVQGTTGMGLGAGLGFLADRFGEPVANFMRQNFDSARGHAKSLLSEYMRRAFPDEQAAQAAARQIGSEGVLADIAPSTQQLGRNIVASSDRALNKAVTGLTQRASKAVGKLHEVTSRVLGTKGKDIANVAKNLATKRYKEYTDIIDDIYRQPVVADDVLAFSNELDDAIAKTSGVKGFSSELKNLKRSLYKDPKMTDPKLSYEDLHLARKAYGDVVEKAGPRSRQFLGEIRDRFDDVFPPEFKTANKLWSGSKKAEEAMQKGRRVLLDDVDYTLDDLSRMSQSEREHYLIGATRAIDDEVGNIQVGGKITGKFNKPNVQDRIRAIMPDDAAYREFMDNIGLQNTYNTTKNIMLSGSKTHDNQMFNEIFVERLKRNSPDSRAMTRRALDWLRGQKKPAAENPEMDAVLDEVTDMLLDQGTVTPEFISSLMKTPLKEKAYNFIKVVTAPGSAIAGQQEIVDPSIPVKVKEAAKKTGEITSDLLDSGQLSDEDVFQ